MVNTENFEGWSKVNTNAVEWVTWDKEGKQVVGTLHLIREKNGDEYSSDRAFIQTQNGLVGFSLTTQLHFAGSRLTIGRGFVLLEVVLLSSINVLFQFLKGGEMAVLGEGDIGGKSAAEV